MRGFGIRVLREREREGGPRSSRWSGAKIVRDEQQGDQGQNGLFMFISFLRIIFVVLFARK